MSIRTWTLENFDKGQYMSWFVTTQAAKLIQVKLYDADGNVYFYEHKQSTSINPPLAMGAEMIKATPVYLDIEVVNQTEDILAWFNNSSIQSATSTKKIGNSFILCGEDTPGGDEDYNDVCVDITVWNTAG